MADERRRYPGAVSFLWCRDCKMRFEVAGRLREGDETPVIEWVVCPECSALRRMVLPVSVEAPFRVVGPNSRARKT
jgi:hypothetical protein